MSSAPPEAPATSSSLPKRSHRDLLAAVASGLVGALALATSTYNVYLQRQTVDLQRLQVQASVMPRLVGMTGFGVSGEDLVLSVVNRGIGPAEGKRIRVKVDGKSVQSWGDMVRALLHTDSIPFGGTSTFMTMISPGQEITLLHVPDPNHALATQLQRVEAEFCYCSALGDCWTLSGAGDDRPTNQPVPNCQPDAVPFTEYTPEELNATLAGARSQKAAPLDAGPAR